MFPRPAAAARYVEPVKPASWSYAEEYVVEDDVLAAARSRAEEVGVVPIGKHYPGYGDIDGDSDHALVTADWPQERVFAEAGSTSDCAGTRRTSSNVRPRPANLPESVSVAVNSEVSSQAVGSMPAME